MMEHLITLTLVTGSSGLVFGLVIKLIKLIKKLEKIDESTFFPRIYW